MRIVAEGGFLISKEVRLRNEDRTPVDYCPCCSKLLYQDKLDLGLAPVMVRTKTEHCLKRTWLWRGRERRGKYAGKGRQSRRVIRLRNALRGKWEETLHNWYGDDDD